MNGYADTALDLTRDNPALAQLYATLAVAAVIQEAGERIEAQLAAIQRAIVVK